MLWLQYSFQIFPEFLLAIAVVFVLSAIFSGILLPLYRSNIGWLEVSLSSYAGLSLFIILNYLLWYVMDWQIALPLLSAGALIGSVFGWWSSRKLLSLKFSVILLILAFITVVLSFFLFKFTYHNGLHDEYFHYAALNLFNHTGEYPFLHSYDFDNTLNDVYHVGSYFLVIAINALPFFDLEQALDTAKMLFFFPFPVFLFHALQKLFTKSPNWLLLFTVLAVLLAGPSWFLRDSFTLWLTEGSELPQIYVPLLYDLAGVTWSGIVFWIVFSLGILILVNQKLKQSVPLTISLILVFLATILVNKAYMLTNSISLAAFGGFILLSRSTLYDELKKYFILIILLYTTLFIALLSMFPITSVLRESYNWGYPYASYLYADGIQVDHSFLKWSDAEFFVSFGAAPFMLLMVFGSLALLYHKQSKSYQMTAWLFVVFAFLLPLGVYMASDSGLGLALNKLLRPAVFFIVLIPVFLFETKQKIASYLMAVLLLLGMVSPLRFFVVNVGEGLQQFWITDSQDVIETAAFINSQNVQKLLMPEWGVAYTFSNLLPIQSYACIDCGSGLAPMLVLPNNPGFTNEYSNFQTVFQNDSFVVKAY